MAPVRLLAAFVATLAVTPTPAETVADWRTQIGEASARFGVPTSWIERVMRAESGGRTMVAGQPIGSRTGAIGLMQLMPATWETMRAVLHLGHNPDDARDNILAGAAYLRRLYDRFGYPGLFAAYNAGPARYADHLATGRALPAETIAYLGKVGDRLPASTPLVTTPRDRLFAVRHDENTATNSPSVPSLASLFVVTR